MTWSGLAPDAVPGRSDPSLQEYLGKQGGRWEEGRGAAHPFPNSGLSTSFWASRRVA